MPHYNFYGADRTDGIKSITNEYPGINSPKDLYDALSEIWCAETCAPRMRDEWSKENKTLGQCSITAFLAQDIFGGKVYGIERPGGNFHCYNVIECLNQTQTEFENKLNSAVIKVLGDNRISDASTNNPSDKLGSLCVFDLTSEQFGSEVLNYENNPEQFREIHFAKEEKRLRYEYLKAKLLELKLR